MLFASFFGRWLDKLGLSARQGIDVVMRQVFFGAGTYHLVDANFEPLPVCMQPHKHHLNAACISAQATLDVEIQVSHFNSAFFFVGWSQLSLYLKLAHVLLWVHVLYMHRYKVFTATAGMQLVFITAEIDFWDMML